jgi:hypothetical protein
MATDLAGLGKGLDQRLSFNITCRFAMNTRRAWDAMPMQAIMRARRQQHAHSSRCQLGGGCVAPQHHQHRKTPHTTIFAAQELADSIWVAVNAGCIQQRLQPRASDSAWSVHAAMHTPCACVCAPTRPRSAAAACSSAAHHVGHACSRSVHAPACPQRPLTRPAGAGARTRAGGRSGRCRQT